MLLVRVIMLALLVFSATAVLATLGRTPAFNPDLQSETIFGNGRTALSTAMYDKGTYDFQRGFGFLMAEATVSADTAAWEEFVAPEAALARALKARDALTSAVSLDPGNAHAWAHLAWALARAGDRAGSLEAWRISSRIAPNNQSLARTRLDLIGLLSESEDGWRALTEADFTAIAVDISVLELFDTRSLAFHMEVSPHLGALRSEAYSE